MTTDTSGIRSFRTAQDRLFEHAFQQTLDGKAEGLLAQYLYWSASTYDKPGFERGGDLRLLGGNGWEQYVKENTMAGYLGHDARIIEHAIMERRLLQMLPQTVSLVSLGGGDKETYLNNEGRIITGLQELTEEKEISALHVVDICRKYAAENAFVSATELGVERSFAVLGDFMNDPGLSIHEARGGTVLTSFGGTLFNAPRFIIEDTKTTTIDAFQTYWTNMNQQFGLGALALVTREKFTPESLDKKYALAKKSGVDAFVLGAWSRAVYKGVITDPNYNPFHNWRTERQIVETDAGFDVDFLNVAKKSHTLPTKFGDYDIQEGQSIVAAISAKFHGDHLDRAVQNGNWEVIDAIEQDNNPHELIVAKGLKPL